MKNQDLKVTVNGVFKFEKLSFDDLNVIPAGQGKFHILSHQKSFHGELLEADYARKYLAIKINGNVYQVQLADAYDQLVSRLGLEVNIAHLVKEVRAPMPGMVLSILVGTGQEVHRGDPLLILEAMKMENVIKSPGDGIIKVVHVQQGKPVEKSQLLLEMD